MRLHPLLPTALSLGALLACSDAQGDDTGHTGLDRGDDTAEESDTDTDSDTDADTDSDTDTDTDTDTDSDAEADVVINELLASNDGVNTDEAGQYEDWIELYNAGSATADLTDWSITDDYEGDERWGFPDGTTIEPGGYLLIWADEDEDDGALHASFKLSADGETLTLLDADEEIVDEVTFGEQEADVSYGRSSDGDDDWDTFDEPTPGAEND